MSSETKETKYQITLLRHAQSEANVHVGKLDKKNCDLSEHGKEQATTLKGDYDLILVSPLRRTLRTLELSKLMASNIEVCELCREHYDSVPDLLDDEPVVFETAQQLQDRVTLFRQLLEQYSKQFSTILVISHHTFLAHLCGRYLQNIETFGFWNQAQPFKA